MVPLTETWEKVTTAEVCRPRLVDTGQTFFYIQAAILLVDSKNQDLWLILISWTCFQIWVSKITENQWNANFQVRISQSEFFIHGADQKDHKLWGWEWLGKENDHPAWHLSAMCSSRKYPYPAQGGSWKFRGGRGKGNCEAKLEFLEGQGVQRKRTFRGRGISIFWNNTIYLACTIENIDQDIVTTFLESEALTEYFTCTKLKIW